MLAPTHSRRKGRYLQTIERDLSAINRARITLFTVQCGRVALFLDLAVFGYAPGVKERRKHHRRPLDEEAELVIPSEYLTLPCRVVNISEGGAGIICDVVPHAATKIRLVMKNGRVFEGFTAWFEDGQLGLRFAAVPEIE